MRRKPLIVFELTAVVMLVVVSFWFMLPRFLDAQNINTSENFPDPNFRRVVEKNMGVDEGERFSAIQAVQLRHLILYRQGISNIKGIEFFTGIEYLELSGTSVEVLDLSFNVNLKTLNCEENLIHTIYLSNCIHLIELDCSKNNLQTIDLSKLSKLKRLNCSTNKFREIEVSKNLQLTRLNVSNNNINKLDVSQNIELWNLMCISNPLKKLDISHNQQLTILSSRDCEIKDLDLSNNPKVIGVDLRSNKLTSFPRVVHPELLQAYDIRYNNLDCDDWEDVMEYKGLQGKYALQVFQYSPQQRFDPYDCSEKDVE